MKIVKHDYKLNFGHKIRNKILYPLIHNFSFFRELANYISFFKRMIFNKPISDYICLNKEGFKDYNIDINWFTKSKKLGISGVARLKDSADFLELTIESFLPYLDEIILVAEQSSDGTNEICQKLQHKYPEKIKYYFYSHEVKFRGYEGDNPPTTNSIHSFAYFTNWAFSKTTYKYVMRLDDDLLPIPEVWQKMREYILKHKPKTYLLYYGINIIKKGNRIGIMKNLPLCGTGGDNGIYPVDKYTYFTQIPGTVEIFHSRLLYKRFGFGFIHLKNLKNSYGTKIYKNSEGGKWYQNFVEESEIGEINTYVDYPISKIYELLVANNLYKYENH